MQRSRDSGAVAYTPLTTPENAPSQAQDELAVTKKQSSLWAQLGTARILVLVLGSIVLVLSVLPLAWLWAESTTAAAGGEVSSAWIAVIKANWTTRIVTICTAIIRAVVTAQASVATAIFAGIILERVDSSLQDRPFYSIARALSGSPTNLLWTPSLPLRGSGLSVVVVALIILEVSLTMATQFLSTLLVADFGNGAFTETTNVTNIRIMYDAQDATRNAWWSMSPAAGWTFAEQLEPFVTGPKFEDTGHTYRVFLPYLEATQRKSLRRFRGPVPIMDQWVVCVQPELRDLRLDFLSLSYPHLSEKIAIANGTYPMLQGTENQPDIHFTCALSPMQATFTSDRLWGLMSLCWPHESSKLEVLVEDPLVTPGLITFRGELLNTISRASTMFMLLDIVYPESVPVGEIQVVRIVGNNDTTSSPWVMVGNGTDAPTVRVTACMANLGVYTFTADLKSNWEGSEPIISWDQPMERYSTASTRSQLGAVKPRQSMNHGGVLALAPRSNWKPFFDKLPFSYETTNFTHDAADGYFLTCTGDLWIFTRGLTSSLRNPQTNDRVPDTWNQTIDPGVMLSSSYTSAARFNAHEGHVRLFKDTLSQTQSPAMCQMIYYETLPLFNESSPAEVAFSRAAVVPTQWTGFPVGLGFLLCHWVVVAIALGLFARYTRHSLLGNHWQAVSQIYSKNTIAILEKADQINDAEVKRWFKVQGH
ncbi:hypothetical protein N7475_004065 [Penicillium sp. IBT 31633x]|nr:hypothetical protein N7475_004065 [Penicillium sp. IBT 31633x]